MLKRNKGSDFIKNKKLLLILGVVFFIVLLSIFYFRDYFIIKKNNEKLQQAIINIQINENETELLLNDIVPFDWDKLYSFSPYEPKENIEEIIGFKSKHIIQTTSEGAVRLIFVKEDKVVSSVGSYPEELLYNVNFSNEDLEYIEIFKEDNVKFLVKKQDNIVYLTESN